MIRGAAMRLLFADARRWNPGPFPLDPYLWAVKLELERIAWGDGLAVD